MTDNLMMEKEKIAESNSLTPLISVIIPVYNVEQYIRQCLDSVLHQTLKSIEIIIIDDGSIDDSGNICDEYAKYDNRIRVVHTDNNGLSCARNYGISISRAQYIMFVDSDDWVEQQYCQLPYTMAVEHNADLVLFTHENIFAGGKSIKKKEGDVKTGVISKETALHYNLYKANAAWLGLYRRKLFDNIQFPPGRIYEDVGTIHRLIYKAEKICILNVKLYNHRIGRIGSITGTKGSKEHPDLKEMFIRRATDLFDWGYEEDACNISFPLIIKYGYTDPELKQLVCWEKSSHVTSSASWRVRLVHMLFKISPRLFDKVCIVTGRRKL